MSSTTISLLAFACVFGGALTGLFLRALLPEDHLSGDSRDTVKVGTAFISTLTALVLGLLVGSAKGTFDAVSAGLTQTGARVILLDRVLARYGPDAMPIRLQARRNLAFMIAFIWPGHRGGQAGGTDPGSSARLEDVQDRLRDLAPRDDTQRTLQSQALQITGELLEGRWLIFEQMRNHIPVGLLSVLIFWLSIVFAGLGLLAPRNATVIAVLLVCALSASGAIFLMLEMNRPLDGWIKAPADPLVNALAIIGR